MSANPHEVGQRRRAIPSGQLKALAPFLVNQNKVGGDTSWLNL